jgi:hypothetical protein
MICGGCGSETRRLTVKLTADGGKPLPAPLECCPNCDGSREAVHSVTDRKLWQGHEVYDAHYKKVENPDGSITYKASDALIQDVVDGWSKENEDDANREARAVEWKRRNRRTSPLTKVEEEQALNAVREQIEEANRVNGALDAGLVVPDFL